MQLLHKYLSMHYYGIMMYRLNSPLKQGVSFQQRSAPKGCPLLFFTCISINTGQRQSNSRSLLPERIMLQVHFLLEEYPRAFLKRAGEIGYVEMMRRRHGGRGR